ncbi:MAG TPA: porin [Longimicrobiales bacterium]
MMSVRAVYAVVVLTIAGFVTAADAQQFTPAPAQDTIPVIRVSEEGVTFRSPTGSFLLRLRGYLHQDARFYNDDAQGGTDAFLLRRVRPVFEATSGMFEFKLMPDFGVGAPLVQDAYVGVNFSPAVRLRAGKYKAPVGLERLVSAIAIRFVERAFPTSLVPNRDVGVQLFGEVAGGVLGYAVGVFNGVVDGGSADTDTNDSKEIDGRLYTSRLVRGLTVGLAGTYGRNSGSVLPSYKTPGQVDFFTFRTLTADGTRSRVIAHGSFYSGTIGVMSEWVRSSEQVRTTTTAGEVNATAWQVSGGVVLSGEANGANGVRPRVPLDPANGHWGAVELVGRVHALDIDDAAFPTFADPTRSASAAHAWGAGADWYWNRNVKLVVNYEHTRFDGGAATGDRPAETIIFTRLQFSY